MDFAFPLRKGLSRYLRRWIDEALEEDRVDKTEQSESRIEVWDSRADIEAGWNAKSHRLGEGSRKLDRLSEGKVVTCRRTMGTSQFAQVDEEVQGHLDGGERRHNKNGVMSAI